MPKMHADQIIIECLKREGVKYWFGSVGEEQHSLLDLMYRDGNVKLFDTRHENSGVVAAIGYSQATGCASVCSGTVGSGVANMFNGMYAAFKSHAPVVAIVCKQPPGYWENDGLKGFNQSAVYAHVTKWTIDVDTIDQLLGSLQRAFRVATSPPTGPVMVCVNRKLLAQAGGPEIDIEDVPPKESYKPSLLTYAPEDVVDEISRRLLSTEFPAALADDRVFWNGADTELTELAEILGMPVCSAGMNFGPLFPEASPLWWGILQASSPVASRLLENVQIWFAIDCDFALASTGYFLPSPLRRIIQVDSDPRYIAKLYPVELGVLGHSKAVLQQVLQRVKKAGVDPKLKQERLSRLTRMKNEWMSYVDGEVDKVKNKVPISPWWLIRSLGEILPEDAYLVSRGGNITFFCSMLGALRTKAPKSVIMRGQEGSLGQAVSKAMGIKLAYPEKLVVALCGDGEFWFGNASELETIKRHKLPIKIVISDNGCFGTNRTIETMRYEKRYVGVNIDNPDFILLAQAFGMHGERVTRPQDLFPALKRALDSEKAAIVDVVTDPDEIPESPFYQRYKR